MRLHPLLTAPTGSHLRIDYGDEGGPSVAVRLQEVFGIRQTPCIGGGAVRLTFKLLSPAQRPVQITRDLAGFWRSSYAEVRKDLRGRYPKHFWPEDPLDADRRVAAGKTAPARRLQDPFGLQRGKHVWSRRDSFLMTLQSQAIARGQCPPRPRQLSTTYR